MALKDKWVDKINEVDDIDTNDINTVANAVIEIEKTLENNGESGKDGENGATFTPSVSADGTLSWTNDKGLDNPPSVNIKGADGEKGDDPKYADAVRVAIEEKRISTSLLQRKLEVGYSRAAKLIDRMQSEGIVSPPDGSKPRAILITPEEYIEKFIECQTEEG